MSLENSYRAIGRLGKTPELRHTTGQNTPVTTISIACNETFKDSEGDQKEITTWIPHVCWGKRAETVCKYLKKGSLVATEGPLRSRSYKTDDDIERYVTECRVNSIKFLDPAPKNRAPDQGEVEADGEVKGAEGDEAITIPEDDIPF